MVFYRWLDLIDEAVDFYNYGRHIARESKKFACILWSKYPKNFTGNSPAPNAIRQFWNDLCFPPPQSPLTPPPPDFNGGQCPVKYDVSLLVNAFPSTINCDRPNNDATPFNISVWGPISRIYLDSPFGNCGGKRNVYITCHGNAGVGREPNPINFLVGSSSYGRFLSFRSRSVSRQDGQPDNCGNPKTDYPTTPPPLPGSESYTVNFNSDPTNNFSFPITWNNIKFEIPLRFDFEVGEIEVNFDGIDINIKSDNVWNINPPPREVKKPKPFRYENPDDFDSEESPTNEETEIEKEKEESIEFVLVTITKSPLRGRQHTILMENAEDSTFFAGYFSWKYGNYRFPEEPIRKTFTVFRNTVGADGFRLYTVNGASVKYTILKDKSNS